MSFICANLERILESVVKLCPQQQVCTKPADCRQSRRHNKSLQIYIHLHVNGFFGWKIRAFCNVIAKRCALSKRRRPMNLILSVLLQFPLASRVHCECLPAWKILITNKLQNQKFPNVRVIMDSPLWCPLPFVRKSLWLELHNNNFSVKILGENASVPQAMASKKTNGFVFHITNS